MRSILNLTLVAFVALVAVQANRPDCGHYCHKCETAEKCAVRLRNETHDFMTDKKQFITCLIANSKKELKDIEKYLEEHPTANRTIVGKLLDGAAMSYDIAPAENVYFSIRDHLREAFMSPVGGDKDKVEELKYLVEDLKHALNEYLDRKTEHYGEHFEHTYNILTEYERPVVDGPDNCIVPSSERDFELKDTLTELIEPTNHTKFCDDYETDEDCAERKIAAVEEIVASSGVFFDCLNMTIAQELNDIQSYFDNHSGDSFAKESVAQLQKGRLTATKFQILYKHLLTFEYKYIFEDPEHSIEEKIAQVDYLLERSSARVKTETRELEQSVDSVYAILTNVQAPTKCDHPPILD